MKEHLANAVLIVCLAGLAILAFGWILYPPLGTAAALLNLAFVLACLAVIVVGRLRGK